MVLKSTTCYSAMRSKSDLANWDQIVKAALKISQRKGHSQNTKTVMQLAHTIPITHISHTYTQKSIFIFRHFEKNYSCSFR